MPCVPGHGPRRRRAPVDISRSGRLDAEKTMSVVAPDRSRSAGRTRRRDRAPGCEAGKPLVRPDGTVVLVDFGVARSADTTAADRRRRGGRHRSLHRAGTGLEGDHGPATTCTPWARSPTSASPAARRSSATMRCGGDAPPRRRPAAAAGRRPAPVRDLVPPRWRRTRPTISERRRDGEGGGRHRRWGAWHGRSRRRPDEDDVRARRRPVRDRRARLGWAALLVAFVMLGVP